MRSLLLLVTATLASACARPIIYDCGHNAAYRDSPARVDARGSADRAYTLEIVQVGGPERGGMCSPPAYAIGEDATWIEMPGGDYGLLAKAQDTASPYAFPLRGRVGVASGHCYVPDMSCDGAARPDATTCRLVVKPTPCSWRWLPRRVEITGVSGC